MTLKFLVRIMGQIVESLFADMHLLCFSFATGNSVVEMLDLKKIMNKDHLEGREMHLDRNLFQISSQMEKNLISMLRTFNVFAVSSKL